MSEILMQKCVCVPKVVLYHFTKQKGGECKWPWEVIFRRAAIHTTVGLAILR
jgi:hypothetical protein